MADLQIGEQVNSCDSYNDVQSKVCLEEAPQGSKRARSRSPSTAPHHKSHRTHSTLSTTPPSHATKGQMKPNRGEQKEENLEVVVQTEGPSLSPSTRRKSWRRSTRGRQSLPALPNPSQTLCRTISTSLPEQERLEKLMEASMRLAVEKTQDSLNSTSNTSLESFQTQVESIQKEWHCLAKDIRSEPWCQRLPTTTASDPATQKSMEQTRKAIHRLQAESESWESLLNKHRSKAEELARRVEQGQEKGVMLDPACLTQSSQSMFIQSKPDYHSLLRRQQPVLHTVEMVMDTQCKMVRELLSIQERSQLWVKETSGRLAADAGFQDLSSDPLRNLLAAGPVSTVSS